MVVALVARGQPVEDVHRLCRSRLLHLHPAKAALQRGILLDVCAEFLIGGGTDELDLAAGQHRLEDAGRINGTLRRTSPHDGVEFVHKEDGGAVPHQLLQQVLEALFKIAPVLGARYQAGHIQRQQPPALQGTGHLPLCDALGQSLGQRSLAHTRLPHQTGVVLLAAAQDFHHAVQLGIPAEHRVQFSVQRAAGQVAAIFIAGTARPRHASRHPRLSGKDKLPGQLAALPHGLSEGHSHGSQQQPRRAAIILQHGTKQVFRLRP